MFNEVHKAYVPVRAEGHEFKAKGLCWYVNLQMIYKKTGSNYKLDVHASEVYYAELWDETGNEVAKRLGKDEDGNLHGTEADWKEAGLIDVDIFDTIDGEDLAHQQFKSGDYEPIF